MFLPSLFTIAKTWEQPKCSSVDEGIRKRWYTMKYYSMVKKVNLIIYDSMDESWRHYAKWNKADRKRYDLTCMWNQNKNKIKWKQNQAYG